MSNITVNSARSSPDGGPEIAGKFVEAAKIYADHPAALQLRAMNIIYECTKERGATILGKPGAAEHGRAA